MPAISRRSLSLSALAGLMAEGNAHAEEVWPARPVRVVIPCPPGGQVDKYGRPLVDALSRALGQPAVVENRAGAGGLIGTEHVSRARPDGYTLLLTNNTAFVGNVVSNPASVRFDPVKDFTPVGIFHESAGVFVTHPPLGVNSFDDFIEVARQSPHPMPFASSGSGSAGALATEALRRRYGLEFLEVAYQGGGPRLAAVLSGEVKFTMFDLSLVSELIASGALRPLIVTGVQRFQELPDIPSFADIGLTEFDFRNWQILLAPAGVPQPILIRLRGALREATRSASFTQAALDGGTPIFQTEVEAEERIQRGFRDMNQLLKREARATSR
jgi:tripartite-type tricarboxylate transporter receptor subunit TctC